MQLEFCFKMPQNNNYPALVWLDLEMTGLDPDSERIIEIATAVTNSDLTEIIEGPNLVIKQSQEFIDNMDEWNTNQHNSSGLVDSLKQMEDSGDEWNLLQKEWNSKLIAILKTNKTTNFEESLNAHLEELYSLGSTSFRDNTEKNQDVIISSLTDIIKSLDATQRKKLTRRLNVYQKSLRKIIKNQDSLQ